MSKVEMQCPNCKKELNVELTEEMLYPKVRSLINPVGIIREYRINSNEIAEFISQKAKFYRADIRTEVGVRYCEKKKSEPKRSYASFRIAFSEEATEHKTDNGWFEKIGETESNVRVIRDIFVGMIEKYRFNKNDLDDILSNYKTMEKLENRLGMTEAYLNAVRQFAIPKRVPINDGSNSAWIIFSARAEKIIEDMLENIDTNKVDGRLEIKEVIQLSKDSVEFVVHVHPNEVQMTENPYVREILLGEKK